MWSVEQFPTKIAHPDGFTFECVIGTERSRTQRQREPNRILAMRRPLLPVAKLRRCRSRFPANHAYSIQETAAITAVLAKAHQATVAVGAQKMRDTLNSRSQTKKELSSKREAITATLWQSRPMPDTKEMKAQR